MSSVTFERGRTPMTQAEFSYTELRRAITSGELPGGSHIVQSDWAEKLGVSVTPIREAIRRLEQDGLAQSEAHKGTTVTGFSLERAEEVYHLRSILDPILIRKYFEGPAQDLSGAKDMMHRLNAESDPVLYADLDREFHCALMCIDDSWTSRIVLNLSLAAAPYVCVALQSKPELFSSGAKDHAALIEAFEEADVDQCVELQTQHLLRTLAVLRTLPLPSE
ncbi:GntR family transcriptional regulator [Corynebacterium sp. H127]|uniref:GntR family transcriptional regulator n=1 Tax=Corynebacterium sp. H127 TaxID=3133418 RepID=UPI0030B573AA